MVQHLHLRRRERLSRTWRGHGKRKKTNISLQGFDSRTFTCLARQPSRRRDRGRSNNARDCGVQGHKLITRTTASLTRRQAASSRRSSLDMDTTQPPSVSSSSTLWNFAPPSTASASAIGPFHTRAELLSPAISVYDNGKIRTSDDRVRGRRIFTIIVGGGRYECGVSLGGTRFVTLISVEKMFQRRLSYNSTTHGIADTSCSLPSVHVGFVYPTRRLRIHDCLARFSRAGVPLMRSRYLPASAITFHGVSYDTDTAPLPQSRVCNLRTDASLRKSPRRPHEGSALHSKRENKSTTCRLPGVHAAGRDISFGAFTLCTLHRRFLALSAPPAPRDT